MPPDAVPASPRRARRVALLLLGASLVLAAGGALWFLQFASQVRRDPALIYREPATLDKLGGPGGAQPAGSSLSLDK